MTLSRDDLITYVQTELNIDEPESDDFGSDDTDE